MSEYGHALKKLVTLALMPTKNG